MAAQMSFMLVDGGAALWTLRESLARAPNARLADLVRQDERTHAFLQAAANGCDVTRACAAELFNEEARSGFPSAGVLFVAVSLALVTAQPESLRDLLDGAQLSEANSLAAHDTDMPTRCASTVSALAWAERREAMTAIGRLRIATEPSFRAIAIAALGARRSDVGPALLPALTDPSTLVRARTYRTIGELGRVDLLPQLASGLTDPDPECRYWSAWAAARMGAAEPFNTLAEIAWNKLPRADQALDLLLRRLDVPQANAWLRQFARLPDRDRCLVRATGVVGDPLYIPWLIEHMAEPAIARLAGEAFSMITGVDLAYQDLDRRPPADFQSGPTDDPADENVALDEDDRLPWPDPARIGQWWTANRARFTVGTAYFLGAPKAAADWLEALSDAFQRQRHAAALELAIRQPGRAMFEVRARGRLQRQLLARARGAA
jgi:uncharacterized protein (TIGR02270 family)